MKGYNKEIGCWQLRHFPQRNNHEKTGMLSYQAMITEQCGQDDRGVIIDWLFIKR
jgi:hypothetical protein